MGDWSDDDSTPAKPAAKQDNDDWGNTQKSDDFGGGERGRGRGRGGMRGGRGGGFRDNSERGGYEGRGRGGYNRNDNDGESRGRGGYNRNENNDGEGREGFQGFRGRGRGRGGFNRNDDENKGGDDWSERPRRDNRDKDDNNNNLDENGEEKPKREVYVPPEPTTNEEEMFASSIGAGINFDKFDKIEVKVTGTDSDKFPEMSTFADFGLRAHLITNIEKSGYSKPTPIQKRSIPIILAKRDLMGCAQTGSGKTAAFVLPILHSIMSDNDTLQPGKPQCLIVAPTRELVIQIFDEARKFAMQSYVKVSRAYGGTASRHQGDNVTQGCHILVATPGRLMDFVDKGIVSFEDLKFLVLDEADRMLDMGFRDTIDKICNHETITKENVTTLMFSATFPESIQHLAGKYLRDYMFLTVGIIGGASTDVEQEFIEVTKFKKRGKLTEILDEYVASKDEDRILVFVETKRTADYLASLMSETKISSTSIHGDRLQREREEALRDFRSGKRKVLIATAVAARGLDIKGVTHVINYDLPKEIDEYVHRIGRTGRVGNSGKATSFFDPDTDKGISGDLVRILTQAGQPVPAFLGEGGSSCGLADTFGGMDIRQPVAVGSSQVADEDW